MTESLRITVLVENTAAKRGLLGEHGLAFWIETGRRKVLFDSGQGLALEHNARRLGVDLASADDVVISHGHYDHVGGLVGAIDRFRNARVYVHPDAFARRYSKRGEVGFASVGDEVTTLDALRERVGQVILTQTPTAVDDGLCVTGAISRRNDFEHDESYFFLDPERTIPDRLHDDQALYLDSPKGVVVLLGCAHSGVVNTLDYVCEIAGRPRIHAVIGGMHLASASDKRIKRTIAALQSYGVQLIAPGHCTGGKATRQLWREFPTRCADCCSGAVFEF